jgi:hypothetical protein
VDDARAPHMAPAACTDTCTPHLQVVVSRLSPSTTHIYSLQGLQQPMADDARLAGCGCAHYCLAALRARLVHTHTHQGREAPTRPPGPGLARRRGPRRGRPTGQRRVARVRSSSGAAIIKGGGSRIAPRRTTSFFSSGCFCGHHMWVDKP